MKRLFSPSLALVFTLITCSSAKAAATRVAFIDPFATARGNAFTATADNASAVFYNAAGLTQIEGTQVQANVFAISLGYEYNGGAGNDSMNDEYQAVPSAFISHKFQEKPLAIGFGMYAPFALGTHWERDASFTQATGPTLPEIFQAAAVPYEAKLQYIKYHAVVAYEVTDTLSISAGLSFDDSSIDVKANGLNFDGDDQTYGYSLSALWQPSLRHSFGLNYQAKTKVTYDGRANLQTLAGPISSKAEADLVLPESIVLGYSYRPNENWNIEFNLDWTNWDRVNELKLDGVPGNPTYRLNWQSAFIWELGITRYLSNDWHISGGYTFVENAVPDADFLPIVPDSDRHFLAFGIGRNYDHISWQLTYQQAFASKRSVSGNQTSPTIDGDYDLDSKAVAVSVSYAF